MADTADNTILLQNTNDYLYNFTEGQKNLSYIYDLSIDTYGNVIIRFVWWILEKAQKMGLKTLYFLARDGYVLREIAEIICHKINLNIDCRYLYCSRQALRIPIFHIIGDKMYEYIFAKAEKLTANVVMSRTGLADDEIVEIYNKIGFSNEKANCLFSQQEYDDFCAKLKKSDDFSEKVKTVSINTYATAIGYFKQEELFNHNRIAIVDSGWSGSIQKTMHILLNSAGYNGRITGFYFGLYSYPKEKDYGDYLTFYFSPSGNIWRKTMFSNNLFECMLSAPHGMTTSYIHDKDRFYPVLNKYNNEQDKLIIDQINGIKKLAYKYDYGKLAELGYCDLVKICKRNIMQTMVKPDVKTAATLGKLRFCDDSGDTYSKVLAESSQTKELNNYLIVPRLFRKINGIKQQGNTLYWVYGVIAFLPRWKQWWYRLNAYIWEGMRYMKMII